ncbi:MAG: hypothetical protein DBY09_01945 [Selenomonadales bacterium]|nr:MAG: hypothetical protein DBY09_01945 [Selenomonadales bacterium]
MKAERAEHFGFMSVSKNKILFFNYTGRFPAGKNAIINYSKQPEFFIRQNFNSVKILPLFAYFRARILWGGQNFYIFSAWGAQENARPKRRYGFGRSNYVLPGSFFNITRPYYLILCPNGNY